MTIEVRFINTILYDLILSVRSTSNLDDAKPANVNLVKPEKQICPESCKPAGTND
jgi:hypothetical protein